MKLITEADIAREGLKDTIIGLQTKLLTVLEIGLFSKDFSKFNYAELQDASDSSRLTTLRTLHECFQRLSVSAHIARSLQPTQESSSKVSDMRIALFDFDSKEVGDLAFLKGEIITVLKRSQVKTDLWWYDSNPAF